MCVCDCTLFHFQNIDTLERRAGIPDERIVEAHGAFNTAHCTTCGKSYPSDLLKGSYWVMVELCVWRYTAQGVTTLVDAHPLSVFKSYYSLYVEGVL